MADIKRTISITWNQELVGDNKDTDSFYLRLTPRFKDKGEASTFDAKTFLQELKTQLQNKTNQKLRKK